MDALEATTNAVLGLALSVLAVWLVFPLFGWAVTLKSNLAVTGLFFRPFVGKVLCPAPVVSVDRGAQQAAAGGIAG